MKFLALAALFVVASAKHELFDPILKEQWHHFKIAFNKNYDAKEEVHRRAIFERNVANIAKHNIQADLGVHQYYVGLNEYADMEHSEFVRTFNGLRIPKDFKSNASAWVPDSNVHLPTTVDWRNQGFVTPIKNQQQCGSCWAFSSTGSLEGQHFKKTRRLVSLSEQNLVDCSRQEGNQGCNGGWMDYAFQYIKINKGIDTESTYPYTAKDGNCHFNQGNVGATVTGYVDIPKDSEDSLKEAVATIGPISVAIDAAHQSFQVYRSGIYSEPSCSTVALDHAVLVIGYGTEDGSDYWLIKNSWGTTWGMRGFMKMARNRNNMCGVASKASYPLV